MKHPRQSYDVCFIVFNKLANDARTLNHARSLVKFGKKVCIIAFASENDSDLFKNDGFKYIGLEKLTGLPVWKHWLRFNKLCLTYSNILISEIYWAGDLYSLWPASKLKKLYGGKLFYDSREIYSALGPLCNHPIKQKIISSIELFLIKNVDEFIVTGNLDAEFLKQYFKTEKKFRIIMNLPEYIYKKKTSTLRTQFNIHEEYKIILYQGMMLPGRGLIPVVNALRYLPDFCFCLLGEGSYIDEVYKTAKKIGVEKRVIYCGFVPYYELHNYICSADIGSVFIEPISFSYRLALPNKLFECCNAGIPVIASDLPAIRDILEKFPFGELVPHDSPPKRIAEAIKQICLPENYENYKKSAVEASKIYCYENQEWILREITGS